MRDVLSARHGKFVRRECNSVVQALASDRSIVTQCGRRRLQSRACPQLPLCRDCGRDGRRISTPYVVGEQVRKRPKS